MRRYFSSLSLVFCMAETVLPYWQMVRLVQVGSDFFVLDFGADVPIGVVVSGVSSWVDDWVAASGHRMIRKAQFDLCDVGCYFEEFLLVSFLLFEIFRHRHARVPIFLPQSQMVRVHQMLDFFFDSLGMVRDIFL